MPDIIPVLFGARWHPPVCLVQKSNVREIRGPAEAVSFMRDNFKTAGPTYSRAMSVCFAALKCEADCDTAKVFFLAAYESELQSRIGHQDISS
jgi:hypothetical protein